MTISSDVARVSVSSYDKNCQKVLAGTIDDEAAYNIIISIRGVASIV